MFQPNSTHYTVNSVSVAPADVAHEFAADDVYNRTAPYAHRRPHIVAWVTDDEQRPFRPCGPEGYDKDDVDAFIDVVEQELARLADENRDLKTALSERDLMIAELQSQLGQQYGDI